MESTGKAGAIQVTQETCEILQTFGYTFEQRGLVAVKGKGQLMTYYLIVSVKSFHEIFSFVCELMYVLFSFEKKGKASDGAPNTTSFSPSLSHNAKKTVSNPATPKSNVIQTKDLNSVTSTPQANPKSVTSPLSSCSNSPSSVRINQNYDPNNMKKQAPSEQANAVNHSNADGDCDLDNSEDADSKPLLNATDNPQIVSKRTNNRYEKSDENSTTKADSDNESETLITNNHN